MNLKRFGIITSFIVIFSLGLLVILTSSYRVDFKKAGADSGFDSSWDSGGSSYSGGGSSWSSGGSSGGSSYDYSSGSSGTGGGGAVVFCAAIMLAIFIIAIVSIASSSTSSTKAPPIKAFPSHSLSEEDAKILQDYGFTYESIMDAAYKSYVNIQYAWSNLDIDKVKKVLSDELYNTYKSQLNVLRAKKQKNVMNSFNYVGGEITSVIKNDDTLTIKLTLSVTCKDYLISTDNNMTVRGDANKINHYTYSLTFVVTKGKNAGVVNCPNCSAKLGEGASVKCEYCGSSITRKASTLTLTRKEMIRQS